MTIVRTIQTELYELHQDSEGPTGFVDRTATLSFNDGTRTLTITGDHEFYINGVKFSRTTDDIVIGTSEGFHYVYYDNTGTLQTTPTWGYDVFYNKVPISFVYWNPTLSKGLLTEERHGCNKSIEWHTMHHFTVGCLYSQGFIGSFTDTTFSIGAGTYFDEDLRHDIDAQTTCNIMYKNGTNNFEWDEAQTSVYKTVTGTIQYNNGTALANVPANNYVAYWIFITNDIDNPVYSIMGQRIDTSVVAARLNNQINDISFGNWINIEAKLIYRVLYRNVGGTPTYIETEFLALTTQYPSLPYIATDHNTLSNLQLAGTGVTYGHINDQPQSIAGDKTFEKIIIDDLQIDGSTISAIPADTNITLTPTGTGTVNCDKYIIVNDEVATTNDATLVFLSSKKTTGTPAAGIGQKWSGYCESLLSVFRPQFEIESTFTDVTASHEDADLTIRLADDGSLIDVFNIDHVGATLLYNILTIDSTTDANINLDRGATSDEASIRFLTASSNNFFFGLDDNVNVDDLSCYSYGITNWVFRIKYSDGAIYMPQVYNDGAVGGRDLYIQADGQLTYDTSTQEAKINITELNNYEPIYNVQPVFYNARKKISDIRELEEGEEDIYTDEYWPQIRVGFIAEDLYTEIPEAIYDYMDGENIKGYDNKTLIPFIVKAVQMQKLKIDELENRIINLETI